ncbi:MAG: alpha-hydroxy-acid oxidizing protein [Clostridia bacterium]|nr:alpha-hydroxy-acid oxidizing protein [Clostridia bacterium]
MDWGSIREKAKRKLEGYCRICVKCDGRRCAGEVPGMGGAGTGKSFINNVNALEEIKINLRTVHTAKDPDTAAEIFGQKLALPVMAAPMTGVSYNMGGGMSEREFLDYIVEGSLAAGTFGMTGDGADPAMYDSGIGAVKDSDGRGVPVIKPREQDEVLKYLAKAEEIKPLAVGMDVDGAGLVTMALKGQPVGPKSIDELKEIIGSTELPFILKGIMTPDEALKAVEVGAKAIVVSNHGGRVLDYTPGVAEVLPEIAAAVGGEITILADGGVRSGMDVLKYIALGAHGVLVGRPLVIAAYGGGAEGVKIYMEKLRSELFQAMILTGCKTVNDIDKKILA